MFTKEKCTSFQIRVYVLIHHASCQMRTCLHCHHFDLVVHILRYRVITNASKTKRKSSKTFKFLIKTPRKDQKEQGVTVGYDVDLVRCCFVSVAVIVTRFGALGCTNLASEPPQRAGQGCTLFLIPSNFITNNLFCLHSRELSTRALFTAQISHQDQSQGMDHNPGENLFILPERSTFLNSPLRVYF